VQHRNSFDSVVRKPRIENPVRIATKTKEICCASTNVSGRSVCDEHARTRAAAARMHGTLSADEDPRFQNSKFMEFMAQVKSGEIKFEDNTVVPGGAEDLAAASREAVRFLIVFHSSS